MRNLKNLTIATDSTCKQKSIVFYFELEKLPSSNKIQISNYHETNQDVI